MAKSKGLLIVLVLLLGFTVLTSCDKDGAENDPARNSILGLDKGMEDQLRKDLSVYFGYSFDHIKFNDFTNSSWYYFGNYNGCVVLTFDGNSTVVTSISVKDVVFTFGHSAEMYVWKQNKNKQKGQIHIFQDAFDLGFLNENDLKSIYEQYILNYVNRN